MFFVYVLKSLKDGRLYKGLTHDLKNRLIEHNEGKQKSTQAYRPWKLVYTENFSSRVEARKKEKYLKSGSGREFLKRLLAP